MAAVDHHDGLLEQPDDAVAEPRAVLDQPALVQAGGAEAALDVGLVELGLGLGDPAEAVGIHRQQPQGGVVADAAAAEQLGDVQHGDVVFAGPGGGLGRGEAERLIHRLQELDGDAPLVGQLPVGTVEALGRRHHRRVQEGQGQRSPLDQFHDCVDREPGLRPGVQQPGPPDLPGAQPRLLGGQGPERDQVAYKALGNVGPLGGLPDAVRHLPVSSRPVGVAAGRIVDQPDIACSSCAAGSWVARCRHPPGTAAPDERPGCLGWDVTRAQPGGRNHATRHSTRPTDTRGFLPD